MRARSGRRATGGTASHHISAASCLQRMTMSETAEAGRICCACGSPNAANAQRCVKCGADMGASEARFVDDDPALRYVDPENRVELERFSRFDHAQLACGLLRSNGIPCELSS